MYLNNATISKWELNGKSYANSKKRFLKDLLETHRFSVQTVLGTKLATGGNVTFMENNGWVIAHVDIRFALSSDTLFSGLTVSILNNNQEIMSSYTDANISVCGNHDIDADLYFVVGSFYPYNSSKDNLPESFFRSSLSQMLPRLDYSKLPDAVDGGDSDADDNAVLVSMPFKVSKGYSEGIEGGYTYNTEEDAVLKVYIDKDDWAAIKSEIEPDFYNTFIMSYGVPDEFEIHLIGTIESNDEIAVAMLINGSTEGEDSLKNNLCARDIDVHVGSITGTEEPEARCRATVKFFIDGKENTDSSYIPIISNDENSMLCVYESEWNINIGFDYESDYLTLTDGSEDKIKYKLGIVYSLPSQSDAISNIEDWNVTISEYDGQYVISISDENEVYTIAKYDAKNATLNEIFAVTSGEVSSIVAYAQLQTLNEDGSIRHEDALTGTATTSLNKI